MLYNEQKVDRGEAERVATVNFPDPKTAYWSWLARREMLEYMAAKNPRVEKPTVHLSLSFHPTETISDRQLQEITQAFLDESGYGKQPYILYRHDDTAHPHVHILTVCVDRQGQKITDTFIKNRMNAIRQNLEIRFGLVQAESHQLIPDKLRTKESAALPLHRVDRQETRQAIDATVQKIVSDYACSSFADFAQLLAAHQIEVRKINRKISSRHTTGLIFRLTNGHSAISPAVKASKLTEKLTFDRLQTVFEQRQREKAAFKPGMLNSLHRELSVFTKLSETDFYALLRKTGIQVFDNGQSYLYLDHRSKVIWNEQELGGAFCRTSLMNQFTEQSQRMAIQLTEAEGRELGRQVTHQFEQYAQETGISPQSRLIEQFPFSELVQRLSDTGIRIEHCIAAVRQFELHKLGQLPLLKAQEARASQSLSDESQTDKTLTADGNQADELSDKRLIDLVNQKSARSFAVNTAPLVSKSGVETVNLNRKQPLSPPFNHPKSSTEGDYKKLSQQETIDVHSERTTRGIRRS